MTALCSVHVHACVGLTWTWGKPCVCLEFRHMTHEHGVRHMDMDVMSIA